MAPVLPALAHCRAVWARRDLIAWPAAPDPGRSTFRLHHSPIAQLSLDSGSSGGAEIALTLDPAGLGEQVTAAHPELAGYRALRIPPDAASRVEEILRGQVVVARYDSAGRLVEVTGVQLGPVLDDLYAARALACASFGVTFVDGLPTFRVWAPTARSVALLCWPPGSRDAGIDTARRRPMTRADDGSWALPGEPGDREVRYLYEVIVYAPTTGRIQTNHVTDPYSVALTLDSTRSVAIDLADAAYRPRAWETTAAPRLGQPVDSMIYELHVRDFSINDADVPAGHRGSYLAFADEGAGRRHLRALATAGLTTVHLLPTFDFATVLEDPARRSSPADLAAYGPASGRQQACVTAASDASAFNWGYDPWHWLAPEGSYASSAQTADGGARIAEFRTMVRALHADGLRVVLDQVYNHTNAAGQAATSVLDRIVPGYYHRLDPNGEVFTSTCCQNVATERALAQRLMVDSVVSWARHYRVDGFRFDLMGHHSKANLLAVQSALRELTLARDGVDGAGIHLYGEGWRFGEVAGNARFVQAAQGELGGTGIGTFSDRLRDAVRGGRPFDEDPRAQGFGTGLAGDDNGSGLDGDAPSRAKALAQATDLVQLGLAGNLAAYEFVSQARGVRVRGDELGYGGARAGYAAQPDEIVTYVDAHDNETLFDCLNLALPQDLPMTERVRMNTLCLATVALAQTPGLWHAGADLLRSKSFDRNSYCSGDWFNTLDWTGADNGFGHGLPPAADNAARWPLLRRLLADPALKPTVTDVQAATAAARDLLRLRFSSPLFRLGSAELICAKMGFPVSGTPDAIPGVIVMHVDDTVGPDLDPTLDGLVVVFNATPAPVSQQLPTLRGLPLRLSAVQTAGADPVVRTTQWHRRAGLAVVPGRTVAVLVLAQSR